MNKLLLLAFLFYISYADAQVKVQDLTEDTTPSATADIAYSIKNYASAPVPRKVKWNNIVKLSGWQDDGTTVTTVSTSDNVAIGTTLATSKLTVLGTISATAYSGDGSGLSGITGAGSSPGGSGSEIQYRGGVQTLSAVSGSSVDSNGNVGLGSATPGTKLDVAGTIRASGDILIGAQSVCLESGTNCPSAGSEVDPVVKALSGVIKSNGTTISAVTAPSGTIVGTTDTQTLTNKTIVAGSNSISGITESMLSTSNNTTNDVSTSKHGFAPVAPNDATKYLDGTGAYSVPPGSGATGGGFTDDGTSVRLTTISDNVGIGTTVPASKFNVAGNVGIGTNANTLYVSIAAPAGGLTVQGNTGIGTWIPTSRLDIRGGAVQVWSGAGSNNTATGASALYVEGALEVDGTATIANLGTATQLNSKNICLEDGTSCPAAAGNGWTDYGTTIFGTTLTDRIGIGTNTSSSTLGIIKQSSVVPFSVSSSAPGTGDLFTVINNGNVGIGTITPGTVLDVNGQARATSFSINGAAGVTQFANANGMVFDSRNTTFTTTDISMANGNLGIGTVGPVQKLEVAGTGQMTGFKLTTSPSAGYVLVGGSTGIGTWMSPSSIGATGGGSGATAPLTLTGSADNIQLKVIGNATQTNHLFQVTKSDATNELSLTNDGNLTIGGYLITNGSTTTQNTLSGGVVVNAIQSTTANGGDFTVKSNGSANALKVAATSGNVGIGTATASQVLQVVGTVDMTGFKLNSSPAAGYVLVGSSVGVGTWMSPSSIGATGGGGSGSGTVNSGTTSRLPYYTAATTVDSSSIYTDATNLGVGTTAAVGRLIVSGGNVGIGTGIPTNILQVNGTSGTVFNVTNGTTSEFSVTSAGVTTSNGALTVNASSTTQNTLGAGLVVNSGTNTTANGGNFQVKTNVGIGTFLVNATSGNIGIGSAAPGAAIDLVGGRYRTVGMGTTVPQAACIKADGSLGYYSTVTFAGVCN